MSDCCSAISNLGCLNQCDTISTGYTAAATGTYTISIVGGGGFLEVAGISGNEITFTNPFNEDSTTLFQIIYLGSVVGSDCYQVKINPGQDLT